MQTGYRKSIYLLLISLISCKGGQEIVIPCMEYSKPDLLIKEIVIIKNGDTTQSTYYYDGLKSILRRNDDGKYSFTVIWKYTKDTIYLLRQDSSVQSYFNIDSSGYARTPSIGHVEWEYDENGYLIKQKEYWSNLGTKNDTYGYTCWNNDEITSEGTDVSGNKIGGGVTSISYYIDKVNTVGNENIGIYYFGKQNNCLIKSSIVTFQGNADTLTSYEYELDSLGRVVKEMKMYGYNESMIRTFTYY
jgi:hypothetical protein